ncbi:MAG TPA: pseudouridine synthase, partial [Polyangiaceae bacterium]|nr:pseudouridine synthase [Polyangiaceae bacterium]
ALLCTNDGEFANRVAHPRHHAPKEYLVKVGGVTDEQALTALRESIAIEGRATKPADVKLVRVEGGKSWLAVRLEEGRNRQVRRLAEHAGLIVMRLVRTSHAGITVEGVRTGQFRHLTVDELTKLRDEYGVPKRIPRGAPPELPSTPGASFRGKNRGERHFGSVEPRASGRPPFRGKERSEGHPGNAEPRASGRPPFRGKERPERRFERVESGKTSGAPIRGKERSGDRGKERSGDRGKERGGRRSGRSASASGGRGFAGRRGT